MDYNLFFISSIQVTRSLLVVRSARIRSAELLKDQTASSIRVLRDGSFVDESSENIVPGDVFELKSGVVPCDCCILSGSIFVDESILTGESNPCRKSTPWLKWAHPFSSRNIQIISKP